MGDYESSYSKELKKFSDKSDNLLHSLEKNVYTNMLAIMAFFAAIFSLVNVNLMAFMSNATGGISHPSEALRSWQLLLAKR